MIEIEGTGESFTIPAEIIAEGLQIQPGDVQPLLAQRQINSWVEAGVDEDFGTFRISFATDRRRFRVVVDALGTILSRSTLDFGSEPLPPGARRPGAR